MLERASELNVMGSQYLLSGDFRSALVAYREAYLCLEAMGGVQVSNPVFDHDLPALQGPFSLPFLAFPGSPPPKSSFTPGATVEAIRQRENSQEAYVMKLTFLFNPGFPLSLARLQAYKAVLLYNLGAVYHQLHSQPEETNRSESGRQLACTACLRLYQEGLELLKRLPILHLSNIKIALLNNLAQVYYELCDYDASHHFLSEMHKQMWVARDNGVYFFRDEVTAGLIANVCFQRQVKCAPMA